MPWATKLAPPPCLSAHKASKIGSVAKSEVATVSGVNNRPPLEALQLGMRVSLELPEAGTCVAVVTRTERHVVGLDLLDDLPEGDLPSRLTLDLFVPRPEGMYHWLCTLAAPPLNQKAELELIGKPTFVQRRLTQRMDSSAQALVRRLRSGRKSKAQPAVVVNVSRGGMKLQGPFQASTGDTVEVSVELDQKVALLARTVMAYPLEDGAWATHVSFLPGQREALEALDGYIARRLRETLS